MSTLFYLLENEQAYLISMGVWLLVGCVAFVVCLSLRRRFRGQRRRTVCIHLALSVWFCLATLTMLELYCALFYDQTDSFSLSKASQRWFDLHVQTNDADFRDSRPFYRTVPQGQRRIVFTGDSFTFGHGIRDVADRFGDRIAARLEQSRPGEFDVSNAAMPGWELRIVYGQLQRWIRSGVDIDVLVYTFVLNDIECFDPRTALYYPEILDSKPKHLLLRESYFLNLAYFRLLPFSRPQVSGYYDYLQQSYESRSWDYLEQTLHHLRLTCLQHGIDLRIVIFPFLHNLGPKYPFRKAHRRLTTFCRDNDVRYVDLEPILSPHIAEGLTVNRFDAHPNERAHELAAEAIENRLLQDLFQPASKPR